MGRLK